LSNTKLSTWNKPASAQMVGMKVVVIKCDEHGNVDIEDLKKKQKLIQKILQH
jgi:glycine cleavage system protein P-like pyridoxal-binding family